MSNPEILLVNATPHEVVVAVSSDNGEKRMIALPPSGLSVRVQTRATRALGDSQILVRVTAGNPEGLPAERPDTVFVVSTIVLTAPEASARGDLLAPYNIVRSSDGQPSHCTQLSVAQGMSAQTALKVHETLQAYANGVRTPESDLAHYRALVAESDPPNKEDR